MTSIEWMIEEMMKKGFFKESVTLTNIDHLQYKAEEMHKQEMDSNCSQVEISDEEINNASKYYIQGNESYITVERAFFDMGAKWYRQQLKNMSAEAKRRAEGYMNLKQK
jgi:hypothetical protein